jgi:hypothetical protein
MPRFRFTIRRMMVAVAIVGVVLAFERFLFIHFVAANTAGEKFYRFSFMVDMAVWNGVALNFLFTYFAFLVRRRRASAQRRI